MIIPGSYHQLRIKRESDHGLYLADSEGGQVLLPSKYVTPEMNIGDKLEVFVYSDSEDRPVATTQKPLAVAGDIVRLQVKDVNKVGAFLDWGLDKDLLLPYKEQLRPLHVGDEILVKVKYDKVSDRVIASAKILKGTIAAPDNLPFGQPLEAVVVETIRNGYRVLLNEKYVGILYRGQVYERLQPGDHRRVYLQKVRDDGRADVLMQPPGYANAIPEAAEIIREVLAAHNGELKVTAKTPSGEIERLFKMSKKTFKKALGSLYKARVVEIDEERIRLLNGK